MLTGILICALCLIFLYFSINYATYRPKGFPPGPPRIPLFGSYLFMMLTDFKYLHKAVLKFSKWYKSDIVGLYMGSFLVVTVHNPAALREVLYSSHFDGRPQVYLSEMRSPGDGIQGIFFKEGVEWKEQRRFLLRHLRDFGFGRRFEQLELVIREEIDDMIDLIRGGPRYKHEYELVKPGGYRIFLPMMLNPTVCNSYFYIMLNERYTRSEQEKVINLIKAVMVFQRKGDDYGKMISIAPWLRHIFPGWSSYKVLKDSAEFTYDFFKKIVEYQLETFDEKSDRNFIDIYLREMLSAQKRGDAEQRGFNTNQFIMALTDFAFPAFTAVGTQIALLIQYLLLYPDVLKRMQSEIDEVVGRGRLPGLEDRQYMHYTEATIREILRIETLVPSDVPHKALVDTTLMGYNVPKGTIVVPSLYAYHNDARVWKDPGNFRPERFLTPDGKLSLKLDVSFPFGAGKRLCAGETFARNMLFLLTSSLCQNFNFVLAPGDNKPDPSKNLSGFIISPDNFWVQLEERN